MSMNPTDHSEVDGEGQSLADEFVPGQHLKPMPVSPALAQQSPDAGGGLYSRRHFMRDGTLGLAALAIAGQATAESPPSWRKTGAEFTNYGQPGAQQKNTIRWISAEPSSPGDGVSWTPLHDLEGTITPNGLHFERHHNGVPEIDTDTWELSVHGMVEQALAFDLNSLHRYPLQSKIAFIECGGNSNSLWYPTPVQTSAGYMHGLLSCSEWTGVSLSHLLSEAGVKPDAKWLVADGLDGSGVTVSLPLDKVLDDTFIALYQNGEPLRRENGYPARLLVPGWEGVVNLKWLRSLQLTDRPLMSRFDTVSYTDLLKDGSAMRFSFEMQIKSFITSPSPGQTLSAPGFYEIRGLAWTGNGTVQRVEVSADGGKSWVEASLQEPVLDRALTRFRAPWNWDGSPALLKSRAYDQRGVMQPERSELLERKGGNAYYHYNGIVVWSVQSDGSISHVYA